MEKFDEGKWQGKLCGQAIEMLREIQDFIVSLDGEKYDHGTEDQKRYRLPDQWQHNLHLVKKENGVLQVAQRNRRGRNASH